MNNVISEELSAYRLNMETYLLKIARKKDTSCLTCDIVGNPLNIGDKVYDRLNYKSGVYTIIDGTETTVQIDNKNKDWLHMVCVVRM